MAAVCIGKLSICSGVLKISELIGGIHEFITKEPRVIDPARDTKAKQICRIFARVLSLIGLFATAVGIFTLGASLITIGAQAGFVVAFQAGLAQALPALITAVATVTVSQIGQKLASPLAPVIQRQEN